MKELILHKAIEPIIITLRDKKVMLDRDLAGLYGVTTKVLNQAVKRNTKRFPEDFMFKLTRSEKNELVTICDRFKTLKHSTVTPYAFTEQGVSMLSTVLNSERAIRVNIEIMRAFVRLRQMIASNKGLAQKIDTLEKKYDEQFKVVFDAIHELMIPPDHAKKNKIGFKREKEK